MYYLPSIVGEAPPGGGGVPDMLRVLKENMICNPTVLIGDWVIIKGGQIEKAQADSSSTMPAIGVVISKNSPTHANVVTEGWVSLMGLVEDKEYYVSNTAAGQMQPDAPSVPGSIVQKVGTAKDFVEFYVDCDNTMLYV